MSRKTATWMIGLALGFATAVSAAQDAAPPKAESEDERELREIEEMQRKRTEDPVGADADRQIAKIKEDYGDGLFSFFFDGVVPRPYLIAAQLAKNTDPEIVAGHFGQILGCLHGQFYREYESMLELKPIRHAVVVFVFAGVGEYLEVATAHPELGLHYQPGLGGYFNPANGNLYMWEQPGLWEVMFHEGTHQLMYHCLKDRDVEQLALSPWLQEGIAEFFGGHDKEYVNENGEWHYEFQLGGYLEGRHKALRQAYYDGTALTVKELVHLDYPKFVVAQQLMSADPDSVRKVMMVYAQGWALVLFLNKAEDGKYEPTFREILTEEVNGRLTGDRFGEFFALEEDADWDDFDREFRDWAISELGKLRKRR